MITVFVVPHTHWDREWYETAARFRQRLVPVVDEVLDVLDRDPAFCCFLLDGQAVILDDYLAIRPEQRDTVARLVRAGRLLAGPWYVLADELLSSDECLVRNLLAGRRTTGPLGRTLAIGYSPDAFGHPAALPTILAGFGIHRGILWRGYGGEPGQELDLFRWRAPDGSTGLFHHLPPPGYEIGSGLPKDPALLHQRWAELDALLTPRAAAADARLIPAGADHHAADPDLPQLLAALAEAVPGHHFRIASPLEYFEQAGEPPAVAEAVGELRFSYRYTWTLQGVHSTRAALKRSIAEADRLLVRWAEPQLALAPAAVRESRRGLLQAAWRDHLLNHFHDSLCGCVTDEVARDVAHRAESVSIQARGLLTDTLHERLGQDRSLLRQEKQRWDPRLVVFSPSPRPFTGVVETTVTVFQQDVVVGAPSTVPPTAMGEPLLLLGPDGDAVPMQILASYPAYERLDSPRHYPDQDRVSAFRLAVRVADLPAFGARSLRVVHRTHGPGRAMPFDGAVRGDGRELAAAWGTVRGDSPAGYLLVPHAGTEVLPGIAQLVSERDEGDTYTFQPVERDTPIFGRWGRPRVAWRGPLLAALARDVDVGARARATVYARVDAGSELVRIVVDGVNLASNHRLRIRFPGPGGSPAERSVADMQYGPVTRERRTYQPRDYPREWPVTTAPVQRYISAAGITVFSRDTFEYELLPDGAVALTLLRAVGDLSRSDLPARPGNAAWPAATPEAQQLGPFRAEFAIARKAVSEASTPDQWDEIERLADEFHAAPAGFMLRYGIDVPPVVAGPELRGAGLAFKALKPAEEGDAVVARCVNLAGEPVQGSWIWPAPIRKAVRARLDETPITELGIEGNGREIRFSAAPREVVTVLVTLSR